jgi:hypothetical protein
MGLQKGLPSSFYFSEGDREKIFFVCCCAHSQNCHNLFNFMGAFKSAFSSTFSYAKYSQMDSFVDGFRCSSFSLIKIRQCYLFMPYHFRFLLSLHLSLFLSISLSHMHNVYVWKFVVYGFCSCAAFSFRFLKRIQKIT